LNENTPLDMDVNHDEGHGDGSCWLCREKHPMDQLHYTDALYRTKPQPRSLLARLSPSLTFYAKFVNVIYQAGRKAQKGQYSDADWCRSSIDIIRALEGVGVCFEISGIKHVEQLDGPCVVISNHMSMLETGVLPVLIQPIRNVTFIVKQSLLEYPVFKYVMRSRDPIAVSRTNPRQDLKAVLEGGVDRLQRGISIIVFPQTTRASSFDPAQFNSIGVKLAQRAQVPIVPLALLSDAWGNGRFFKDFGKIDVSKTVRFAFGEPIHIQGRGTKEHQAVVDYVGETIQAWKQQRQSRNA
jgi:1-acyl-sn-glycerol-3-phosphate acyltransferase